MYLEPEGGRDGSHQQQAAPDARGGGSGSEQEAAPHAKPGSSAGQEANKDDLGKLTVAQLKDRLRERGLPVSGVKVREGVCTHGLRMQRGGCPPR